MPLDDLLAEYGQGIVDILGENVVEIHRNADDGKLYYLPSWQGLVGDRRGWLVVTEIAELAGDTWIEDTEAALNKWRNNYSGSGDQVSGCCKGSRQARRWHQHRPCVRLVHV